MAMLLVVLSVITINSWEDFWSQPVKKINLKWLRARPAVAMGRGGLSAPKRASCPPNKKRWGGDGERSKVKRTKEIEIKMKE